MDRSSPHESSLHRSSPRERASGTRLLPISLRRRTRTKPLPPEHINGGENVKRQIYIYVYVCICIAISRCVWASSSSPAVEPWPQSIDSVPRATDSICFPLSLLHATRFSLPFISSSLKIRGTFSFAYLLSLSHTFSPPFPFFGMSPQCHKACPSCRAFLVISRVHLASSCSLIYFRGVIAVRWSFLSLHSRHFRSPPFGKGEAASFGELCCVKGGTNFVFS